MRFLPSFCLMATLLAAPAALAQGNVFNDGQKEAIGQVVKDYLLKNPEVLTEVMAELEKRQSERERVSQSNAIMENRKAVFDGTYSIVAGNPKGDVTIVEYFDYNCSFCKRALSDMQALVKADPNIRLILKDFPVLGPDSLEASKVALAVKNQLQGEKLFAYHVKVLESRGRVNGARAMEVAEEMGADTARIKADMESATVRQGLQANAEMGDKLGIAGTPAFVIENVLVPGAVGLEPLKQVVASVRQCGKAEC